MKRVTRLSRSIFGGILFSLSLFHLADGAARAEILHLDSHMLNQQNHTYADGYERGFVAFQDIRITDVILRLSETISSNEAALSTMTATINGSSFSYVSHDIVAGTVQLSGNVEISSSEAATLTVNCGCGSGIVYLSETDGAIWSSNIALWDIRDDQRYPRLIITENERPTVASTTDQQSIQNHPFTLAFSATDPENDRLSWSAGGLPTGVTINRNTGEIAGAPEEAGTHMISVTAEDTSGGRDTQSFTWIVTANNAPRLSTIRDQTFRAGISDRFAVSASDADGDEVQISGTDLPPGIAYNAFTGFFEGQPTTPGTYASTIIADDGFGGRTTESLTWTITANNAPVISGLSDQQSRVDVAVSLSPTAMDSDNDLVSWSVSGLPTGLEISFAGGQISGTPTEAGTFNVQVTATDILGAADTQTISWVVAPNNAPVINAIADQSTRANTNINLTPVATDADSDPISWTAEGLPVGITINANTGALSGTPTFSGIFETTLTATDNFEAADSVTFNWAILANNAPQISLFGNQAGRVNVAVNLPLTASDADNDTLSWQASGLPTGVSINADTGVISGTPTAAGSYTARVNVRDAFGGSDNLSFAWLVAANDVPVIEDVQDVTGRVNDAAGLTVTAYDANSDTLTFSATGLPSGVTLDSATGVISGTPSAIGSHNVTVTVSDGHDGSAATTFTWNVVANQAPVIAALATQENVVDIAATLSASATDADDANLTWSAAGLPTGLSIDTATGVISGTPTAIGTYTVSVSVADGQGGSDSESFDWVIAEAVAQAAPPAQETPPAAAEADAQGDAAQGDASQGDAAEGDAAEGDAAEGDAAQGDAAQGDAAQGDAVEGDAAEGDAAEGDAAEGDAAEGDASEQLPSPAGQQQADAMEAGPNDAAPTHHITHEKLTDVAVINALETSRQSLLPVLNPVMNNSFSRLSELIEQAGETDTNRSSLGLKLAFADQAVQQIADIGTARAVGDIVSDEVDSWLPDGWAVWSRGEVSVGKLKAAETGDNIDIDGNQIAIGADKRVTDKLTLGGFFQTGTSKARFGGHSETEANSLTAYGSFILSDKHYLQAALGISDLTIDMRRMTAGDVYEGTRDGSTGHILISAAQTLMIDEVDVLVSVEAGRRRTSLASHTEGLGQDGYHYYAQNVRDDHLGVKLRLNESLDTDYGLLSVIGEVGYRADVSRDSRARMYKLADTTVIYTHDVDRQNGAQSQSHARLSLGASLQRDNGWHYKADTSWQEYSSGYIAGLNISAKYKF
jgi:hypothetical protein